MANGIMGISSITPLSGLEVINRISTESPSKTMNSISSFLSQDDVDAVKSAESADFSTVLKNAINGSLNDTQSLIDSAEAEEINFAIGNSDNTHDLQIAQQKASLAVSYTVAVRDRLLDAYKEIMNMQF